MNFNRTATTICCALAFGLGASMHAHGAPVTHYSQILLSGDSGSQTDFSGGILEDGRANTTTYAYANGSGGYVFKPTSLLYAHADLSTGELKASASVGFGTNLPYSGAVPDFGVNKVSFRSEATIADSFSFTSGSNPYIWNDGARFAFNFMVSGTVDIPGVVQAPVDHLGSLTYASLSLRLYRPGGLEALEQVRAFEFTDYSADEIAEYNRLQDVSRSLSLGSTGWCLGESRLPPGFCSQSVELGEDGALIDFTFDPGGDFEWNLTLFTQASLDISYENLTSTVDFSQTIKTGFTAPDDATVHSASGLFPNTLPLAAEQTVPQPSMLLLVGAGLLGVFVPFRSRGVRRR